MVEVPRKVDEQVELVISSLAAPFEKKRKHAFLAVAGGVLLCAIVALIIIFIPKGNTYTAGDGSTANTKVSDSVKTTSTLDETLTYYADIVIKDQGTVTVKLDHKSAPVSASNFVELAESGFYDGLTFHRIIENFMMQGGDPAGDGFGGSGQNILGEFSDNGVENDLSHTRGAISMARSNDYNSASSQFFIVHEDSTHLDGSYAVFGYVTAGMEIVDAICETAQPTDGNGTIPAADQPVIETVNIRTA
ncbi:MAG: peptidylprolyl isomerase [Clostridia bacterium]|nr:peptidylprolyl isomerase [Clostridia bacterium]